MNTSDLGSEGLQARRGGVRRSVRNLLALSVATAAAAVVVAVPVASADAVLAPPASRWGPFFSNNGQAKAVGTVNRTQSTVTIAGELSDLDRSDRCARVEFLVHNPDGRQSIRDLNRCSNQLGTISIDIAVPVARIEARVSQIDRRGRVVSKGAWHTIFTARSRRLLNE